jgi:hypothetical protein
MHTAAASTRTACARWRTPSCARPWSACWAPFPSSTSGRVRGAAGGSGRPGRAPRALPAWRAPASKPTPSPPQPSPSTHSLSTPTPIPPDCTESLFVIAEQRAGAFQGGDNAVIQEAVARVRPPGGSQAGSPGAGPPRSVPRPCHAPGRPRRAPTPPATLPPPPNPPPDARRVGRLAAVAGRRLQGLGALPRQALRQLQPVSRFSGGVAGYFCVCPPAPRTPRPRGARRPGDYPTQPPAHSSHPPSCLLSLTPTAPLTSSPIPVSPCPSPPAGSRARSCRGSTTSPPTCRPATSPATRRRRGPPSDAALQCRDRCVPRPARARAACGA